ncbi:MAG: hypothetical protein ABIY70_01180 [Capsulimonas sp.]|uniref:alpha/beta fold hydrolase n=1 Tax=Capsulimonas sp. TaxID=2494211 RepID=UPI003267EBBB
MTPRTGRRTQDLELHFDPTRPDLRTRRPYYLIPLLEMDQSGSRRAEIKRMILAEAEARRVEGRGISDIFLFSHGWHRNFFSAVSAYDRIFSRFLTLMRRGRIQTPPDFHPLFLAVHWHSDTGQDGWIDRSGRRVKSSFMQNVQTHFEPGGDLSDFLNDFEEIYELFSQVSSPDISIQDTGMDARARSLTARLDVHRLRGVPPAKPGGEPLPGEREMLAWRCYQEAEAKRVLIDQGDKPARYNNPLLALSTLLKFIISAVGAAALIGFLTYQMSPVWGALKQFWKTLNAQSSSGGISGTYWPLPQIAGFVCGAARWGVAHYQAWVDGLAQGIRRIDPNDMAFAAQASLIANLLLSLLIVPTLALLLSIALMRLLKPFKASGPPFLAVLAWLPLQLTLAAPILTIAGATFVFRTWIILLAPILAHFGHPLLASGAFWVSFGAATVSPFLRSRQSFLLGAVGLALLAAGLFAMGNGLVAFDFICASIGAAVFAASLRFNLPLVSVFTERVSRYDVVGGQRVPRIGLLTRDLLAGLARLPIWALRQAIPADSGVHNMTQGIENQLAFFEMQRKGVCAGIEAADFMDDLLNTDKNLGDARVHLIGHSFGGLVMVNLARHLGGPVQTLCLLQAAIASAWFDRETELMGRIQGALACVFSGYDTANGFYYPFSNGGRLAAGYVGLCDCPADPPAKPVPLGKDGLFASLSEPPRLNEEIRKYLRDEKARTGKPAPWGKSLNLDASRLIYEGDPKLGGGHDDIFKDDVVHLMWATMEVDGAAIAKP